MIRQIAESWAESMPVAVKRLLRYFSNPITIAIKIKQQIFEARKIPVMWFSVARHYTVSSSLDFARLTFTMFIKTQQIPHFDNLQVYFPMFSSNILIVVLF